MQHTVMQLEAFLPLKGLDLCRGSDVIGLFEECVRDTNIHFSTRISLHTYVPLPAAGFSGDYNTYPFGAPHDLAVHWYFAECFRSLRKRLEKLNDIRRLCS